MRLLGTVNSDRAAATLSILGKLATLWSPTFGVRLARASIGATSLRYLATAAVCILLTATLLACTVGDEDSVSDQRVLELEATVLSLEESLEAFADENAELKDGIAILRQEQTDFIEAQEVDSKAESALPSKEQWTESKGDRLSMPDGTALERTVVLAEDAGGVVHYIDHPVRQDRTVLVTPLEFVDGETPLIVSLHGYGGNSADHAAYFPLHERVNTLGFALLLPTGHSNGKSDAQGNPFWNPTDHCCDGGKSGEDDVAYLTELVAEAMAINDFGPVYFFGYSNGGFMSHHIACKGLPGLRAVASLAGTSYVEDSSCDAAPPVSVLHIHGTADSVIRFEGEETEPDVKGDGERAFYASAQDMVTRWSQRAGCDWPENTPLIAIDLDGAARAAEQPCRSSAAGNFRRCADACPTCIKVLESAMTTTSTIEFRRRAASALMHPVTLAALAVLLANDLLFKALWPGAWIPGKLSDLAWMMFAPPALAYIISFATAGSLRAQRIAFATAYAGLPLLYAAFNTFEPVHDAILRGLGLLGGDGPRSPLDATDSLVIPFAMVVALWVWLRPPLNARGVRARLALLTATAAAIASVATSYAQDHGITEVGRTGSGTLGAHVNAYYPGSAGTYESMDGGLTWTEISEDFVPLESQEWSELEVMTPSGDVFFVDATNAQIVRERSEHELSQDELRDFKGSPGSGWPSHGIWTISLPGGGLFLRVSPERRERMDAGS